MSKSEKNPGLDVARKLGKQVRDNRTQNLSPGAQQMLREVAPSVREAYHQGLQGKNNETTDNQQNTNDS